MAKITTTVFANAEQWLKDNLRDFEVDGISSVWRTKLVLEPEFSATYKHEEDEGEAPVIEIRDMKAHVDALRKLVNLIDNKKLFVGGVSAGVDLVDPCNWDVEVVDAYFQLVVIGEVIYG